MEFWGVEVKSGESLRVEVGEDKVLHLSQATLGEVKKDKNESVCIFVEVDGKKLVLGTLIPEKIPQQLFDLVFNDDFVLTHNLKNGSVYFYGYMADQPYDGPEDEFDDESDSEDEAIPLQAAENGKLEAQPKQEKKAPVAEKANAVKDSNAGKQKVKIVEPSKKDDDSDDDSDDPMSDDDGSDSEGDDSLDDEDDESSDDEDDSDDDEDSDNDETPQKVQAGKKRTAESVTKTPVADKKAKLATPQKTDGKKGGPHVATPHPSKKTPGNKSGEKSPKSGGSSFSCTSCKKNFKNEGGLSAHNKAKHGAA